MNTKKLFMLLAVVLLGSVSAMAQSGNNEPLKGDVNEDGTVDVADIVDVIKILKDAGGAVGEKMCYWYAGTEQVETDNFTDVASRIPESEIPETGSVTANGQYVYFVMPKTKHLESITDANGSAVEITCTDVMGYHIYKTSEIVNTTVNYTIKQTTYYWYVGTASTKPSSLPTSDSQLETGTNEGWRKFTQTSGTVYNANTTHIRFNKSAYYWLIIPTGMKVETSDGNNYLLGFESSGEYGPDTTTIPNYTIYASRWEGGEFSGIIKY